MSARVASRLMGVARLARALGSAASVGVASLAAGVARSRPEHASTSSAAVPRTSSVTNDDATTTFGYSPVSGQLTSVASTDGGTYALGYDGALIAVNGDTVAMAYDKDGLLRQAGALTIARNAATGLPDSTTLGAVRTTYRYDPSGAIAGATTTANGSVVYAYDLQRDSLGRIVHRIETMTGMTTDTRFAYDSAGRLFTVTRDGVVEAAYTYDANGNRLARTTAAGVASGFLAASLLLTFCLESESRRWRCLLNRGLSQVVPASRW